MGGSAPASGALDASLLLPDVTFERYYRRRRLFLFFFSWGSLPPSVRHTTLPAIHRQVLMWLLEDMMLWFVYFERIETSLVVVTNEVVLRTWVNKAKRRARVPAA